MIIVALIILGLCLGSFVNALVYRLHWQETHKSAKKSEKLKYSIKKGRSICPNCKHPLEPKDLVPIFSWLALRGKCRYCHKSISWQYPLVEASTVFVFIISYVYWPYGLSGTKNIIAFALWLVFLTGFIALIIYDIKYLILPNKIIFPLIIIAIIGLLLESIIARDAWILESSLIGLLIGGGFFYVLFQLSDGAWIGGGDVKLGFLLGLLLGGPWPALLMLFLASLLGTVFSLPLMLTRKIGPKSHIPFGPFLIIAAIIIQIFGSSIMDWYTKLAGTGY